MEAIRLTLAWFNETNEYLVKRDGDISVSHPDQVIFSLHGDISTPATTRELVERFYGHLAQRGIQHKLIANLDDIQFLSPHPKPTG